MYIYIYLYIYIYVFIQIIYKGFVLHPFLTRNGMPSMTSHFQASLSYTPAYHQLSRLEKTDFQVGNTSIYGHDDYGSSKEC